MAPKTSAPRTDKILQGRSGDLSDYQVATISKLRHSVHDAILQDPGLPRPNPTVSAWQVPEHPTVASVQSPTLPSCTEFLVIGSGITGCSVTKALLEHSTAADSHVTVLEARTLVSGATGRNGGHLVTASGHTYGPLAKVHGPEIAKQITRFSILNINHVMKMVRDMDQELQEDCQIRDVRKVMAVRDYETWEAARSSVLDFQANVPEYRDYHRIVQKDDIPKRWNIQNAVGAIEHDAGAIWPYRLLTGIYERLLRKYPTRLAIEANTPATVIKYQPNESPAHPYVVTTPRGIVRAKRVIHCTNAHASHLLPRLTGRIYPFRGTMSVQKPGPSLKSMGSSRSWSLSHKPILDARTGLYNTGLFYLQQNPRTGSLWIGNETAYLKNIFTSDDTVVPNETREVLSSMLPKFFLEGWDDNAQTSEIEAIWSGIQGHTADGLPVVGRVPGSITGDSGDSEQWIAAGFNGYGMDKCWLTGEALVKMMFGEDVSEWFPQSFLLTETRLKSQLTVEGTVSKFAAMALPDKMKVGKL